MSAETLSRLGLKPSHKPMRAKYDSQNRTHQAQKNNDPQTGEDKFQKDNIPWIMSLRPLNPESRANTAAGSGRERAASSEGEEQEQKNTNYIDNPPSFYEADTQKF